MKSNKTTLLKISIITLALIVLYLSVFWLGKTIATYQYSHPNLDAILDVIKYGLNISSLFFYIGIYYILEIIKLIEEDIFFSSKALNALSNLKHTVTVIFVIYIVVLMYTYFMAGLIKPIFITGGIVVFIISFIIIFIETFIQLLEKAVNIKLENDLTI